MTDKTHPDAGEPARGTLTAAKDEVHAHLLTAARDDFIKRLEFLVAYAEQWTGRPERRPPDTPVQQLREEWQREGVIVRRLVANISKFGRSFVDAVEHYRGAPDDHQSSP